jgi:Fe(3+) dicitrate transport protein
VHIRDEVAGGVVANIGFRGLNPDRSESILLLEDGVLAGFAPYTVNAAYYVPPSERIAAIEILKGSGQILYGPHTVGPVLNLITHEIPRCPSGRLIVTGGSHDHYSTYASYGATRGRFGFLVSALATWSDGYRDHNSFEVLDAMLKTRWSFSRRSHLTAKFAAYSSDSQNTYLGLTTGMFAADPYQNPAARDVYETAWYNGQLTWKTEFNRCLALLVNVYAAGGSRDWNRQDFARNNGFAAPPANTQFTVGDPAVDGGAIYMRESFGSRDRDSIYWGIEPRLTGTFHVGGRRNDYEVGVRFHDERYTNERNNRTTFDAPPTTRDRDVNDTHALSFFAQDRVRVNRWLHLIGGVRVEHYESTRRFEVQAGMPVAISGTTTNTEVIPGLGFTAQVGRGTTVFGGVHRGFAPPRVAQAIDATGMDLQLDAEKSWNYEIGVRGDPRPWLHYEAAGFYMDFENQVVPANESGGASTMNTNAGETEHLGFELAGTAEVLQPLTCRRGPCRPKLYLDASYTYVHTENTTPAGTFRGNDVPYAPNHLARVGLRGELPVYGLTAAAVATYTGSQFADQANTIAPSNDGTTGKVEDRWLLDVTLRWKVQRTRMTLFASVNNVLDETYIVSRAPSGIFAGAPRHAFFGFELDI